VVRAALPYHRLAGPAGWRTALGTVLILAGTVAASTVLYGVAMVGGQVADVPRDADDLPILPPLADTAVALAGIAVGLPLVLLAARLVQRRPAGTVSSVLGRLRWGWLAWCLPLAFAAVVVFFLASFVLAPFFPATTGDPGAWVGGGPFLRAMLVLILIVPFQAAAEEYAFRGWLLQGVGSLAFLRGRLWPAIVVQAVLFAAVHGWGTVWGFVDLVIWACFMGWVTVRTGGLEAAIALHLANNLMSMAWSVAFGTLDLEVTAADMSVLMLAIDIPVVLGYTLAVTWLARRRQLPTTCRGAHR
jgi:membrane protease YdiL (CAAX protease family)